MILQQQFELEFGDNYEEYLVRTLKFIKTLFSKAPLAQHRSRIFDCEGGDGNLLRIAFSYIVEKGDFDEGLTAFAGYLNEEYSSSNNRNITHHTKVLMPGEDAVLVTLNTVGNEPTQGTNPFRDSSLPPSQEVNNTYSAHSLKGLVRTEEEAEFFTTFADLNNSIVETCKALDWPIHKGRKIYFRVKRRAYAT